MRDYDFQIPLGSLPAEASISVPRRVVLLHSARKFRKRLPYPIVLMNATHQVFQISTGPSFQLLQENST